MRNEEEKEGFIEVGKEFPIKSTIRISCPFMSSTLTIQQYLVEQSRISVVDFIYYLFIKKIVWLTTHSHYLTKIKTQYVNNKKTQ